MIVPLKTINVRTSHWRDAVNGILVWLNRLYQYQQPQILTDNSIINWSVQNGYNAQVTLVGSRTLAVNTLTAGDYGTLKVIQGGSGSYTLTLPSNSKVSNGGAGAVTLSTAVGSIDILTFYYDGTTLFWNRKLICQSNLPQ